MARAPKTADDLEARLAEMNRREAEEKRKIDAKRALLEAKKTKLALQIIALKKSTENSDTASAVAEALAAQSDEHHRTIEALKIAHAMELEKRPKNDDDSANSLIVHAFSQITVSGNGTVSLDAVRKLLETMIIEGDTELAKKARALAIAKVDANAEASRTRRAQMMSMMPR